MNTSPPQEPSASDDQDPLARLIAQAGPRAQPPAELESRVREAAAAAWREGLQNRRQRRAFGWAAAATALLVIGIGWRVSRETIAEPVASFEQRQGEVLIVRRGTDENPAMISVGDDIRTGAQGGARIALNTQVHLRLAASTHVRWLAADQIALDAGAVYIDSGPQHGTFTVATSLGAVSHFGTRYQVRLSGAALNVAVREGEVRVATSETQYVAHGREQLSIDRSGRVARAPVSVVDSAWAWADALAPGFVIENRSLDEFLRWLSDETGQRLEYADASVAAAARETVLHGLSQPLAPTRALDTVLPTTDFAVAYHDERLIVSRK